VAGFQVPFPFLRKIFNPTRFWIQHLCLVLGFWSLVEVVQDEEEGWLSPELLISQRICPFSACGSYTRLGDPFSQKCRNNFSSTPVPAFAFDSSSQTPVLSRELGRPFFFET